MPYIGNTSQKFVTADDVTVTDDLTVTDDATIGGNLLVNKTSTNGAAVGGEIRATGLGLFTADGTNSLQVRRLSDDGDLVEFYKDGNKIGIVGVLGDRLSIGTGDVGLFFNNQTDQVQPINTTSNAARDNAISLGATDRRFKDLYLSGGVFLGGTGDANKLVDYEEGSWTPSLGGNTSYNSQVGKYTKVGNKVTVWANIYVNSIGTGSARELSGLPFAPSNISEFNVNGNAVSHYQTLATSVSGLFAIPTKNATTIKFTKIAAGGSVSTTINDFDVYQNSTDSYFNITYRTG